MTCVIEDEVVKWLSKDVQKMLITTFGHKWSVLSVGMLFVGFDKIMIL
jgi:hypothetical protein